MRLITNTLVSILFLFIIPSDQIFAKNNELLSPSKIKNIISDLSEKLSKNYVHKQVAGQYAQLLTQLPLSHELFMITDPDIFKIAVTDYLQSIHADGHLRVYDPKTTERLLKSSNFDDDHDATGDSRESFLKVIHQNDRFVHLKIHSLPYGESYEEEVVALLSSLPETQQLVLDLRNNYGGSARTVRAMLNCLFVEVQPLYTVHVRSGVDKGEHSHFSKPIATCNQIAKTPIVILVNEKTASSAELLALLLKNRKRATLIGKQTYGAGNPVELFQLLEGYSVYIPISTIVDSLTGEGFELSGVTVDIITQ